MGLLFIFIVLSVVSACKKWKELAYIVILSSIPSWDSFSSSLSLPAGQAELIFKHHGTCCNSSNSLIGWRESVSLVQGVVEESLYYNLIAIWEGLWLQYDNMLSVLLWAKAVTHHGTPLKVKLEPYWNLKFKLLWSASDSISRIRCPLFNCVLRGFETLERQ